MAPVCFCSPHIQSSCLRFRVDKRFVGVSIEECLISSLRIQPFCPQHRASKKCRRGVDSSYGRSGSELPTYVIVLCRRRVNRRFAGGSIASMLDLLLRGCSRPAPGRGRAGSVTAESVLTGLLCFCSRKHTVVLSPALASGEIVLRC
jgi:hypothetical protein